MNTCLFPDCTITHRLNEGYCIIHKPFYNSTITPFLCTIPKCNSYTKCHGKGRSKTKSFLCHKHEGNPTFCCVKFCTVDVGVNLVCEAHTNTIEFACIVAECNTIVLKEGLSCERHEGNVFLCCTRNCTSLAIYPSSMCMPHHKLGRCCGVYNCFRQLKNKITKICPTHFKYEKRCAVNSCRADMFLETLCVTHYQDCYGFHPTYAIDSILYENMLSGPMLFPDLCIDMTGHDLEVCDTFEFEV